MSSKQALEYYESKSDTNHYDKQQNNNRLTQLSKGSNLIRHSSRQTIVPERQVRYRIKSDRPSISQSNRRDKEPNNTRLTQLSKESDLIWDITCQIIP
jgi:hypothetical protein